MQLTGKKEDSIAAIFQEEENLPTIKTTILSKLDDQFAIEDQLLLTSHLTGRDSYDYAGRV